MWVQGECESWARGQWVDPGDKMAHLTSPHHDTCHDVINTESTFCTLQCLLVLSFMVQENLTKWERWEERVWYIFPALYPGVEVSQCEAQHSAATAGPDHGAHLSKSHSFSLLTWDRTRSWARGRDNGLPNVADISPPFYTRVIEPGTANTISSTSGGIGDLTGGPFSVISM